jgi:hypothetical protein
MADLSADRIAISDVTVRYGMAVDGRDWDAYRAVFTPDAHIDYTDSGGIAGPLDEIVPWLAAALEPFAGLHHNMTNHLAEVDGDSARACTYFLAYHTIPDGAGRELVLAVGGHYRDRLVRTAEAGWRIAERVELSTWLDGPYPEGVPMPSWYGTLAHPRPQLPD